MFEFIGAAAVTIIAGLTVHYVIWRLLRHVKSRQAKYTYIALLHQHSLVTDEQLPYYARLAAADALPEYLNDFERATAVTGWHRFFVTESTTKQEHLDGLRAAVTDAITDLEESKPTS